MVTKFLIVPVAALAVAGCNAPAANPMLANPRPIATAPAPVFASPAPMERVSERSTTSISADGRSTVTRTTRTSVGVNPGVTAGAAGALLGLAVGGQPQQPGARQMGMVGSWRATTASSSAASGGGSVCKVLLYGEQPSQSGRAASSGCAFGGPLNGLTSWRMMRGRLELMRGGMVSLALDPLGPDRFDGVGPFRTTISLTR